MDILCADMQGKKKKYASTKKVLILVYICFVHVCLYIQTVHTVIYINILYAHILLNTYAIHVLSQYMLYLLHILRTIRNPYALNNII